jgi:hypothetical protein
MLTDADSVAAHDVMQVCRNGHVITDRLRSDPQSGRNHCDRCGAATLTRCGTCGADLPAAAALPGLVPLGTWPAPPCCPTCGAVFPWARKPRPGREPVAALEALLGRLPLVIRQLRWRQGDRTPFTVIDERDLEDLVRSVLPLRFDDVRMETRTPAYSPGTRTDFLLAPEKIALTVKVMRSDLREAQLVEQWKEDIAYYRPRSDCRTLVGFAYDPAGLLRDGQMLRSIGGEVAEHLDVRFIVGAC